MGLCRSQLVCIFELSEQHWPFLVGLEEIVEWDTFGKLDFFRNSRHRVHNLAILYEIDSWLMVVYVIHPTDKVPSSGFMPCGVLLLLHNIPKITLRPVPRRLILGGLDFFVLGFFSFLLLFLFLGIFFLLGVTLVKVLSLCPGALVLLFICLFALVLLRLCLGALVNPSTLLLIVRVHRTDPLSIFFLSEALRANVKIKIRCSILHKS